MNRTARKERREGSNGGAARDAEDVSREGVGGRRTGPDAKGKEEGGTRARGEGDEAGRRGKDAEEEKRRSSSEWMRYASEIVRDARCWLSNLTRESSSQRVLSFSFPLARSPLSSYRLYGFFLRRARAVSPRKHLPRANGNSDRQKRRRRFSIYLARFRSSTRPNWQRERYAARIKQQRRAHSAADFLFAKP